MSSNELLHKSNLRPRHVQCNKVTMVVAAIPVSMCSPQNQTTRLMHADQELQRPRDHILVADLRSPKSTRP